MPALRPTGPDTPNCSGRRKPRARFSGSASGGAGSYGAGLARYLNSQGQTVTGVARPARQHRARHRKSNTSDAQAAAGAIISGDGLGTLKSADGIIEAMWMLRTTRASAVRSKTSAVVALQSLGVTAPDQIRNQLIGLSPRRVVRAYGRLSPES